MADGLYSLWVQANDQCGNTKGEIHEVIVDNTAPTAIITSPVSCSNATGILQIIGTANDANLANWTLQYTGGAAHGWVTVNSKSLPVSNGLLGSLDTSGLIPCCYTLRLAVSDKAILNCNSAYANRSEYTVSFSVGDAPCTADLNGDGKVDLADFVMFAGQWLNGV